MSAYALNLFPESSERCNKQITNAAYATKSSSITQCRVSQIISPRSANMLNATISDAAVDPSTLANCLARVNAPIQKAVDSTSAAICNKITFFVTVSNYGSTYVAKRTLSQFKEFRNNLLKEWSYDIILPELPPTPWDEKFDFMNNSPIKKLTIPQSWQRDLSGLNFASMLSPGTPQSNFFGSGFTKLRSLWQGYIPSLNHWLSDVCEILPTSYALLNFLWEPTATRNDVRIGACLESITEGGEEDILDEDSIISSHHSIALSDLDTAAPCARSRTCSSDLFEDDSLGNECSNLAMPYAGNLNQWQSTW